ncbi:MAG: FHA domain-containing protein [Propionibacteriaceae bacterium]|nr:FHA domain-containing protein [Propionibacteriaceae bacterium]
MTEPHNQFSALWEHTLGGGVEAAAVRAVRDEDEIQITAEPLFAYRLLSDDGQELDVLGPVIIGRSPKSTPEQPGVVLAVPSPSKSVSRNHLVVELQPGGPVATDLGSMNGSYLVRGGEAEQKLVPRQAYKLVGGDRLRLGDDAWVTFIVEEVKA